MIEQRRPVGGDPVELTLTALVGSMSSPRVVDVGGGSGTRAVPLAIRGCSVTVIDSSVDALAILHRRAQDAGVEVDGMVVQALASGLAVLTDSERELTTVLIDIGGGTTDVGVFRRGTLTDSAVIPLGGDHITQDISQLLRIPPTRPSGSRRSTASRCPNSPTARSSWKFPTPTTPRP